MTDENSQQVEHKRGRSGLGRAVPAVFLVVGVVCLVLAALVGVKGGPWDRIVRVNNPRDRLIWGVAALAASFLTRRGFRRTAREWAIDAGKLTLLALSAAVSLLVAESAFRLYLRKSQGFGGIEQMRVLRRGRKIRLNNFTPLLAIVGMSDNKRLVFELRPGLELDFDRRHVKINELGMRASRSYSVERVPGSVRIVGLGDSGMFGWGVEQEEPYMAVLEQRLNARPDETTYEVLNMAVPAYNTQQEVELFVHRGQALRPDIVIVGWCKNDFSVPFIVYKPRGFNEKGVSYLYCFVFDRRGFAAMTRPQTVTKREIDHDMIDPELLSGVGEDGVRAQLSRLRDLSRSNGFKLLVFGPMEEAIMTICDELGIHTFNTFDEIPADKYPREYRVHGIHPRAGGHRALAEHLEAELDRRGWLVSPR